MPKVNANTLLACDASATAFSPVGGGSWLYQGFRTFEFRWGRHAEFLTYVASVPPAHPRSAATSDAAKVACGLRLRQLPPPGVISGLHVEVNWTETSDRDHRDLFEGHQPDHAAMIDHRRQAWTVIVSTMTVFIFWSSMKG